MRFGEPSRKREAEPVTTALRRHERVDHALGEAWVDAGPIILDAQHQSVSEMSGHLANGCNAKT